MLNARLFEQDAYSGGQQISAGGLPFWKRPTSVAICAKQAKKGGNAMNNLTITNLDGDTARRLKKLAWHKGQTSDEFVRHLVIEAAQSGIPMPPKPVEGSNPAETS